MSTNEPIVHRLPNEILTLIFSYFSYQHDLRITSGEPIATTCWASREMDRPWVSLMLVCRRWNAVFTHTPELWSNIPFASPALTKQFLDLSRDTSISLAIPIIYGERRDKEFVSSGTMMLKHLHRTQTLYVKVGTWPTDDNELPILARFYLPGEFTKRTPESLSTLHIVFASIWFGQSLYINDNIFPAGVPRLRKLSLSGVIDFDPSNPIFSNNLTSLSLLGPILSNTYQAPDVMLDVLERVGSTLEILYLKYCLNIFEKEEVDRTEAVPLMSLTDMYIKEKAQCMAILLEYVRLPPLASLKKCNINICATADAFVPSLHATERMLSNVFDQVGLTALPAVPLLYITYITKGKEHWVVGINPPGKNEAEAEFSVHYIFYDFKAYDRLSLDDQGTVCKTIVSPFTCSAVKVFQVEDELPIDEEHWEWLLERLGAKLYKIVAGDFSDEFANALRSDVGTRLFSRLTVFAIVLHELNNSEKAPGGKLEETLVSLATKRKKESLTDLMVVIYRYNRISREIEQWAEDLCKKVKAVLAQT